MEQIVNNYVKQMRLSFDFKGSSTRSEYWTFWLSNLAISLLIVIFCPLVLGLFQLITFFAGWACLVRRFRDADVTPWAILAIIPILIVPFMGSKK